MKSIIEREVTFENNSDMEVNEQESPLYGQVAVPVSSSGFDSGSTLQIHSTANG